MLFLNLKRLSLGALVRQYVRALGKINKKCVVNVLWLAKRVVNEKI